MEHRRWLRTRAVALFNGRAGGEALADVALRSVGQHGNATALEAMAADPTLRFDDSTESMRTQHAHRLVGDFDGYGTSGRFVSLMQSNSAVLRSRLFADWTDDTTIPWFHYVPMSVRMDEAWPLLEHMLAPAQADALEGIALEGQRWARTTARKDDMVLYAWRLVLEWARMTHDGRDSGAMDFVGSRAADL